MIDLKNKPEGATHTFNGELFKIKGKVAYIWREGWFYSPILFNNINLMPLAVACDWTTHNNTLPLSDLSDDQRGLLFNHGCNGGSVEALINGIWVDSSSVWHISHAYRAKQKTERELFIDSAMELSGTNLEDISLESLRIIDEMFTAGFKAPKVGE
jgi:hypothetical protein